MKKLTILAAPALLFALAACGGNGEAQSPEAEPPADASASDKVAREPGALLDAAIEGDHRTAEEKARDQYRNPKETLEFFGVAPDMTVVEIWPGGGWYTNVIAPYLNFGGGTYYAAGFSREGASERAIANLDAFEEKFAQNEERYGDVRMSVLGEGEEIAPAGTADVVLTFRNVHNWLGRGAAQGYFDAFYDALKPGGVLGVVEHRADGADLPRDGSSGYVYTDDVIELAANSGFELDARSDVNANPADTKDHPFGVWTLPPVRRSSAVRGEDDPNFDRAAYDAIGESDRMTLKFRKPIAADGALLE